MNITAKHIAATPKRTAIEVWQVLYGMISEASSPARQVLTAAGGVAAAIISDEVVKDTPIVLTGSGPRLRFYCVYGEDAVSGDNCNEEPLINCPTINDWHVYLPCNADDLSWVSTTLESISPHITAYNKDKVLDIEKAAEDSSRMTFDPNIFRNKI